MLESLYVAELGRGRGFDVAIWLIGVAGPGKVGSGGWGRGLACFFVGEFFAVYLNLGVKVEGEANPVAADIDDADDAKGVLGVTDDDLFADASCEYKHAVVSSLMIGVTGESG
jgi:hypothetical protein